MVQRREAGPPAGSRSHGGPVDDMETPRSAVTELDAASQPRRVN